MQTFILNHDLAVKIADRVVKLIDEGYRDGAALLLASSDYDGVPWDFIKGPVRELAEEQRPEKHHHRKQPTYAANVHAAYESAERKAG